MDDPTQTSSNPTPNETHANDIVAELRELGRNLQALLRASWESEERKKVQTELQAGLNDLGKSLSQAATEFQESPAGQTLKADLEDLHQRIQSGEVESKVRSEVLSALRLANEGLKKAGQKTGQSSEAEGKETA